MIKNLKKHMPLLLAIFLFGNIKSMIGNQNTLISSDEKSLFDCVNELKKKNNITEQNSFFTALIDENNDEYGFIFDKIQKSIHIVCKKNNNNTFYIREPISLNISTKEELKNFVDMCFLNQPKVSIDLFKNILYIRQASNATSENSYEKIKKSDECIYFFLVHENEQKIYMIINNLKKNKIEIQEPLIFYPNKLYISSPTYGEILENFDEYTSGIIGSYERKECCSNNCNLI